MLKVALCLKMIGRGGGDALLCTVLRDALTLSVAEVFIERPPSPAELERGLKNLGHERPRIHISEPDIDERRELADKVNDCDVIVSWSCATLANAVQVGLTKPPVVEVIQGTSRAAETDAIQLSTVADYFVAVSQAAAAMVPPGNECRVIYTGADVSRVVSRKGRANQRKSWMIGEGIKVLTYIGRIAPGKHAERLITTVARLPREWVGVICGEGDDRGELKRLTEHLAPGRVFFVDDPWANVGDLLAASDCLLLHSEAEGDPIVVHEAQLAGVPVVVSDLPVMREHQTNAGQMLYKLIGPQTDVAAAVVDSQNPAYIANVVRFAQKWAFERFTTQAIATEYEVYLDYVVNTHRRRRLAPPLIQISGEMPQIPLASTLQEPPPQTASQAADAAESGDHTLPSMSNQIANQVALSHARDRSKTLLHLVYDVPNWAYAHVRNQLERYCPDGFAVSSSRLDHARDSLPAADIVFNMVYAATPQLAPKFAAINPQGVFISGVNTGVGHNDEKVERAIQFSDYTIHNNAESFEKRGQNRGDQFYLPNGVDLELFGNNVRLSDRPRRVLWCGSKLHAEHKGLSIMQSIAPKLAEKGIETDLYIADSYAPDRTHRQMAEWYTSGRVFVIASESEGTPNPGLEAAAAGLAIVSTPVGNMPELICSGRNGIICRRVDTALLRAIVVADRDCQRLATGMSHEIAKWDWSIRAVQFFDLMRTIMRGDLAELTLWNRSGNGPRPVIQG